MWSLVTPAHNADTGESRGGSMVRSDIMAEVWMGKVFIGDGSLLVVSRPKMENINKADTMRHNGHNTPLAPILGVNGSTGAGFQQAPYKYKLTTLTDISPCSLTPFQALDLPDIVQQINALLKSNQLSPKINVKPSSKRLELSLPFTFLRQ